MEKSLLDKLSEALEKSDVEIAVEKATGISFGGKELSEKDELRNHYGI